MLTILKLLHYRTLRALGVGPATAFRAAYLTTIPDDPIRTIHH